MLGKKSKARNKSRFLSKGSGSITSGSFERTRLNCLFTLLVYSGSISDQLLVIPRKNNTSYCFYLKNQYRQEVLHVTDEN